MSVLFWLALSALNGALVFIPGSTWATVLNVVGCACAAMCAGLDMASAD